VAGVAMSAVVRASRAHTTAYEPGRVRTAEGTFEVAEPQVRGAEQPFRSSLMGFLKWQQRGPCAAGQRDAGGAEQTCPAVPRRDGRSVGAAGRSLCGPSVDHDTSDVSAHLRRERPEISPFSLLSQLKGSS
jgi:hypothetical protein